MIRWAMGIRSRVTIVRRWPRLAFTDQPQRLRLRVDARHTPTGSLIASRPALLTFPGDQGAPGPCGPWLRSTPPDLVLVTKGLRRATDPAL